MRRNLIVLSVCLVLLMGCGQAKEEQNNLANNEDSKQNMQLFKKVQSAFDNLNQYDGIVSINDLNSAVSHSDMINSVEGVFEQDEWIVKINPLKQEGKFSYKSSMYNILNNEISMLGEGEDVALTYDNLLKKYIYDDNPYEFTLSKDKVTKVKGSPSFYCDKNCPGAYYGKTKSDTNNYIVDSFSKEDSDKITLGFGRIQGSSALFNWIDNYKNRMNLFLDIQLEDNDIANISVKKSDNENTSSIVLKRNLESVSNEKKDEILAYLNHGTNGVWEMIDAYITVQIDKDGYPLQYEELIKAKHIQTKVEIPLYSKVLFQREIVH